MSHAPTSASRASRRRRTALPSTITGCLAVLLIGQTVAGMPYVSQKASLTATSMLERSLSPEALSNYVAVLAQQQSYGNIQRALGRKDEHPLDRRGWGGAPVSGKKNRPIEKRAAAPVSALAAVTPVSSSSSPSNTAEASASSDSTTATSASASSTSTSTPTGIAGFFNPHNKMYPLAIAVCVAIGACVMMLFIFIAKRVSHANMTADEKAGIYGEYSSRSKEGGKAIRGARSIKRAFTKKKLGSFARRNEQGSVLIDVGDEVYAVTPEVAREYERERAAAGGSSGGSRLTSASNQSSSARQALKNAEMTVAASRAGSMDPTRPMPRDSDIDHWRASSARSGANNKDRTDGDSQGLARVISQRVTDSFRALRGKPIGHNDAQQGYYHSSNAFSFDTEKQGSGDLRQAEVPASAYLPIMTRGAHGWDINVQSNQDDARFDEHSLKSKGSEYSLANSHLSHERHTLSDEPVRRSKTIRLAEQQMGPQPPQEHYQRDMNSRRPKSILVKQGHHARSQHQNQGLYRHRTQHENVLPYSTTQDGKSGLQRNKTTMSRTASQRTGTQYSGVPVGSAKTLQERSSPVVSSAPLIMRPTKPQSTHDSKRPKETNAPQTRELFRPLPPPPPFTPFADK